MIDGSWLVMSQGPQPGQTFMLDREWLTIGRDPSNDIVINDPQVSRQHARITRQGQMVVIEDLGSTNGTFANGVRLTGSHVMSNGDVIGLGDGVTLTYYEVGIAADIAETVVGQPGSAVGGTPPPSYRDTPISIPSPDPSARGTPPTDVPATAMPEMPVTPPPSAGQKIPPAYTLDSPEASEELPVEGEKKRSKLTCVVVTIVTLFLLVVIVVAVAFVLDSLGVLKDVAPFLYTPLEWLGLI
jgi:predicted component of type VI protein secretion system